MANSVGDDELRKLKENSISIEEKKNILSRMSFNELASMMGDPKMVQLVNDDKVFGQSYWVEKYRDYFPGMSVDGLLNTLEAFGDNNGIGPRFLSEYNNRLNNGNFETLRDGSNAFKNDKDLVEAICLRNPFAFGYAGDSLKNDKDFILNLMNKAAGNSSEEQKDNFAIELMKHASDDVKKDKTFVVEMLKHSVFAVKLPKADEMYEKNKEVLDVLNDEKIQKIRLIQDDVERARECEKMINLLNNENKRPEIVRQPSPPLNNENKGRDPVLNYMDERLQNIRLKLKDPKTIREEKYKILNSLSLPDLKLLKKAGGKTVKEMISSDNSPVLGQNYWRQKLEDYFQVTNRSQDYYDHFMTEFEIASNTGTAENLKGATDAYKNDKDLVLKICGREPKAFQYASDALKNDKDFIILLMESLKENYPSEPGKMDELVSQIVHPFFGASERLMKDPEFLITLHRFSPKAVNSYNAVGDFRKTVGEESFKKIEEIQLKTDIDDRNKAYSALIEELKKKPQIAKQPLPPLTAAKNTSTTTPANSPVIKRPNPINTSSYTPGSSAPKILEKYNELYRKGQEPLKDNEPLTFPSEQAANQFFEEQMKEGEQFIYHRLDASGKPTDYYQCSFGDGKIYRGSYDEIQKDLKAKLIEAKGDESKIAQINRGMNLLTKQHEHLSEARATPTHEKPRDLGKVEDVRPR